MQRQSRPQGIKNALKLKIIDAGNQMLRQCTQKWKVLRKNAQDADICSRWVNICRWILIELTLKQNPRNCLWRVRIEKIFHFLFFLNFYLFKATAIIQDKDDDSYNCAHDIGDGEKVMNYFKSAVNGTNDIC